MHAVFCSNGPLNLWKFVNLWKWIYVKVNLWKWIYESYVSLPISVLWDVNILSITSIWIITEPGGELATSKGLILRLVQGRRPPTSQSLHNGVEAYGGDTASARQISASLAAFNMLQNEHKISYSCIPVIDPPIIDTFAGRALYIVVQYSTT